ncbi:MAG TPA: hypothetical protein VD995_28965 [Azospirillum sp.]|nr:hypothetical protein [Azospirillum sp.]
MAFSFRIAAIVLVLALAPEKAASPQERLENGEACSDGRPRSIPTADARCRSGKCRPGPAINAQEPDWYCLDSFMQCALPGTDGRRESAFIDLNGTRYQCLDPGTGSPHRFAPIR